MNNNSKITSIDAQWIEKYYDRITALFILSRESLHNTHQWAISLALGFITVILAINSNESTFPNELSLIITLLSFPLLVRFFIRSCLECAIQHRFIKIRNELDIYLSSTVEKRKEREPDLIEVINCYYIQFQASKNIKKIIWENLQLAYLWIFIVWTGLIVWGFLTLPIITKRIIIILFLVIAFILYEIISFLLYERLKYKELSI